MKSLLKLIQIVICAFMVMSLVACSASQEYKFIVAAAETDFIEGDLKPVRGNRQSYLLEPDSEIEAEMTVSIRLIICWSRRNSTSRVLNSTSRSPPICRSSISYRFVIPPFSGITCYSTISSIVS